RKQPEITLNEQVSLTRAGGRAHDERCLWVECSSAGGGVNHCCTREYGTRERSCRTRRSCRRASGRLVRRPFERVPQSTRACDATRQSAAGTAGRACSCTL